MFFLFIVNIDSESIFHFLSDILKKDVSLIAQSLAFEIGFSTICAPIREISSFEFCTDVHYI